MKKLLLLASAAILGLQTVNAQETVKSLYEGSQAVTWENTLQIEADKFADGVNVGDFISIALSDATDVLEIKADGTWLPGSRLTFIDGASEYRAYITTAMLAALQQYGLEICGKSFTVTGVEIKNDGFQMPDGAIWGGFFWVENWNTLELFKTAFDSYAGEKYLDIYMEAENDAYVLNVLTKWDDPAALWTNDSNTVKTATKATIDLSNINVKDALADVNALMIQLNPEGGRPFNVTAVALRPGGSSASEIISADQSAVVVYNLQGMPVRSNVSATEALENLPAGIYIVNGKKYAVK